MASPPDDTLILLPRVQRREAIHRQTRAEIDLSAVAHNFAVISEVVRPAKVLAVIKADAYGHGVVPTARRLQDAGVFGFGVALAEEAIELRDAGITTEILILNGLVGHAHREILERNLTPVVYSEDELVAFGAAAAGRPFSIHLKVDTGMRRLGVSMAELPAFLDRASRVPGLHLAGLMTHLASADEDDEFTLRQLAQFAKAREQIRAAGHQPERIHAANTAAAFRFPQACFNLIRSGIGLFGHPAFDPSVAHSPEKARAAAGSLRLAMRLRSEVIALKHVELGDRVGYSGTYRPDGPRTLAILPIGYGDGLLRANSGQGVALVRGRRCPIVGRVSMDLTHVDVTEVPGVSVHDEAVLLGAAGGEFEVGAQITLDELARTSETVPYEVLTNVSRRVPRFYL